MQKARFQITSLFVLTSDSSLAQITISETPSQVMDGIGASGAWWPIDLYNYPENVRNEVADLLFSSDNLGLSSYRYNVGGGGVFVGNPT